MTRLPLTILMLTLSTAAHAAVKPVIWLADGMTRVSREEKPRPAKNLVLHAARGEWEPLQAVIHASPEQLKQVDVDAATILHASGAELPPPEIFHEHYVRVSKSTMNAPLPPGEYPDALLPLDMPAEPHPAVEATNQPFWIDVFVPYAAAAGDYKGTLRFRLADGTSLTASFTLHVWSFDLPVVPRLRTSILTTPRSVSRAHGIAFDGSHYSLELAQVLNQYHDLLARHRLAIDQIYSALPEPDGTINEEKVERALRRHLLHRHASTISIPIWPDWPFKDPLGKDRAAAMKHIATYAHLLEKIRCANRGYVIMGDLDEPNDADAYATVRRWGEFFNEVEKKHGVRVPLMITEQPTPEKAAWGSLVGAVDIWCPHFSDVWNDMEWAGGSHDIAIRRQGGDEVWAYAALVQNSEAWANAHQRPKVFKSSHSPVWCTDYPPINHRIHAWLFPKHGITGFSYWDTLHQPAGADPWKDAGSFHSESGEDVYNGDGFFIYPATQERHGRNAPVASMRLKWLRESADDYDYLMLARELGLDEKARQLTETFARGFGDWDDNVPALLEARTTLGRLVEQASERRHSAQAAPTPSF